MSVKETTWNKVKSILTANTTLSAYVKVIYEGVRDTIPPTMLPCIILEPRSETEAEHTTPYQKQINFSIDITAVVYTVDNDKQFTGVVADGSKGIFDFTDDIKNALWVYPDLDNTCTKFSVSRIDYNLDEFPIRHATMTLDIMILVNKTGR